MAYDACPVMDPQLRLYLGAGACAVELDEELGLEATRRLVLLRAPLTQERVYLVDEDDRRLVVACHREERAHELRKHTEGGNLINFQQDSSSTGLCLSYLFSFTNPFAGQRGRRDVEECRS